MNNDREELLRRYYELHPELKPKLDSTFLQSVAEDPRNIMPEPPMSIGDPASTNQMEHPMSIGVPARTDLPIQPTPPQIEAPIAVQPRQPASISTPQPKVPQLEPTTDVQFGQNLLSTVENLRKAQGDRDAVRASARRDRLASLLARSQTGIENDYLTGEAERKEKLAGEKVTDFEQQVQMQKQDPNSSYSKGLKDFLKQKYNINIKGDASGTDIEKIAPWAIKSFEAEENRQFKSEENKLKREEIKATKEAKGAEKASKEQNDFVERASRQVGRTVKDYQKVRQASQLAASMDPKNAVAQVTALYNLISSLDPQSTVREGEISLATSAGGLKGKIDVVLSQLSANPEIINEKTVNDIRSEIARIAKVQEENYKQIRDVSLKQAKSRGISEDRFGEIDPYYDSLKGSGGYSESQERGIKRVMDINGISREEAISALQEAGKLK